MAKSANQKLKILCLMRMLARTDEKHLLTMNEILDELAANGISAERKSVYDDMDALRAFGAEIVSYRGRYSGYYLKKNPFASECIAKEEKRIIQQEEKKEPERLMPKWFSGETQIILSCDETALERAQETLGELMTYTDTKEKKGRRKIAVTAEPSAEFFGWMTGFGVHAKIAAPLSVAKSYRRYLKEIRGLYKEE